MQWNASSKWKVVVFSKLYLPLLYLSAKNKMITSATRLSPAACEEQVRISSRGLGRCVLAPAWSHSLHFSTSCPSALAGLASVCPHCPDPTSVLLLMWPPHLRVPSLISFLCLILPISNSSLPVQCVAISLSLTFQGRSGRTFSVKGVSISGFVGIRSVLWPSPLLWPQQPWVLTHPSVVVCQQDFPPSL